MDQHYFRINQDKLYMMYVNGICGFSETIEEILPNERERETKR